MSLSTDDMNSRGRAAFVAFHDGLYCSLSLFDKNYDPEIFDNILGNNEQFTLLHFFFFIIIIIYNL